MRCDSSSKELGLTFKNKGLFACRDGGITESDWRTPAFFSKAASVAVKRVSGAGLLLSGTIIAIACLRFELRVGFGN